MAGSKRRRWIGLGLLVLVFVGGLVAWYLRDLPRARVESGLAEKLGAKVELAGFHLEGPERVRLDGLVVRDMGSQPRLDTCTVDTLIATGPLSAMLDGRFDRLTLRGTELRLISPARTAQPAAEGSVHVGELLAPQASVIVESEAGEAQVVLDVDLRDVGGAIGGTIEARGTEVPTAPLLSWFGATAASFRAPSLHGLRSTVRPFEGGRAWGLELNTGLQWEAGTRVEEIGLQVWARRGQDHWFLTAEAELPFLQEGRLELELADDGSLARGEVRACQLDLARISPALPVDGAGRGDVVATMREPNLMELEFDGEIERLVIPDAAVAARDLELRIAGRLTRTADGWTGPLTAMGHLASFESLTQRLPLDGLAPLEAHASAHLLPGSPPALTGRLELATRRRGLWELDGTLPFASEAPRSLCAQLHDLSLEDLATGSDALLPLPSGASARGPIQLEGVWNGSGLEAALLLDGTTLQQPGVGTLRGKRVAISLEGVHPLRISSLIFEGVAEIPPLDAIPFTARGSLLADVGAGVVMLPELLLDAGPLGRARFQGLSQDAAGQLEGDIAAPDLKPWKPHLVRALGSELLNAFELKGSAQTHLRGQLQRDGSWASTAEVELEAGLASDDGSRVVDGLTAEGLVQISGSNQRIDLHSTHTLGGFQILWNSFYGDLSHHRSTLVVTGHAQGDPGDADAVSEAGVRWSVRDGPEVTGRIRRGDPWVVDLGVRIPDLTRAMDEHLRPLLEDAAPGWAELEPGGSLSGDVRIHLDSDPRYEGSLDLTDFSLSTASHALDLRGVSLHLPVDLTWAKGSSPRGPPQAGHLSVEHLRVEGLSVPPFDTEIAIHSDDAQLEEELVIPLLAGRLRLTRLAARSILSPDRHIEAAMALEEIDVARTTRAFDLPVFSGTLNAQLPRVRMTADSLQVDGGGEASVFGGRLSFGDIEGRDLFGGFPRIIFSVEMEEIDLGQVTRTFDVGEMTGTLSGWVRGCELFRGIPVRFEARLETIEQPGVPQKINVKAINNLAILGTGAGTSVFDRGIHRLLDTYTYEKLGVQMRLESDVFLLRGLQQRGDRELFLKGRLPFRIDVVNGNPGGTVSFQTMLERLRNIDFGEVRTE